MSKDEKLKWMKNKIDEKNYEQNIFTTKSYVVTETPLVRLQEVCSH
jgi:hypothetical protein